MNFFEVYEFKSLKVLGCLEVSHFIKYYFYVLTNFGSGMCLEFALHHFGTLWPPCWLLFIPFCFILASKIAVGGAPRRFRKRDRAKNAQESESFKQMDPKMGSTNRKVGGIFDDVFKVSRIIFGMNFECFWGCFLD